MTSASTPSPASAPLTAQLLVQGLITAREPWELRPVAGGGTRLPEWRREHFHIIARGRTRGHLVAGRGLDEEFRMAREFAQACPGLSCRPLFHVTTPDGKAWICYEHFDGKSLDERVAEKSLSGADWLAAVEQVQSGLETTQRASTRTALEAEASALLREGLQVPTLTETDRRLLRDAIPGILESVTASAQPTIRLSNGDFTGRNILINDHGELRLIDLEFATWTHFGEADWLRLERFSVLPGDHLVAIQHAINRHRQPHHELFLALQHFIQLRQSSPAAIGPEQFSLATQRLLLALAPASLLVRSTQQGLDRAEAALAERTAWAGSLEADLAAARLEFDHLRQEFAERTAWAERLEQDLAAARTSHAELAAEDAQRLAWARSLEADLTKAREQLARLQQEFTERTAWALKLKQEVATLQAERLQLEGRHRDQEAARLTAEQNARMHETERQRLQAELVSAQLRIDALMRDLTNRANSAHPS